MRRCGRVRAGSGHACRARARYDAAFGVRVWYGARPGCGRGGSPWLNPTPCGCAVRSTNPGDSGSVPETPSPCKFPEARRFSSAGARRCNRGRNALMSCAGPCGNPCNSSVLRETPRSRRLRQRRLIPSRRWESGLVRFAPFATFRQDIGYDTNPERKRIGGRGDWFSRRSWWPEARERLGAARVARLCRRLLF